VVVRNGLETVSAPSGRAIDPEEIQHFLPPVIDGFHHRSGHKRRVIVQVVLLLFLHLDCAHFFNVVVVVVVIVIVCACVLLRVLSL
jgi:hypothetical protein